MFIIVYIETGDIVYHGSDAQYVKIENGNYVQCDNELEASGIYVNSTNILYPTLLYSLHEVEKMDIIDGLYEYKNNTVKMKDNAIPDTKAYKLNELSEKCVESIITGIDVETSYGLEHFSLTVEDQLNIQDAYLEVLRGATQINYHSDDKTSRLYSAEEIATIALKAKAHKNYHVAYFNLLKEWVERCTSIGEINEITYGCELPEDLASRLNKDDYIVKPIGEDNPLVTLKSLQDENRELKEDYLMALEAIAALYEMNQK